ncbi:class D sortase [Sporosarcina sp. OR05]|uniref:class D sortase n=1 Tax=Sporosarcina sp. OR05 TaxID=2969819 RepID=UPI00352A21AA
MRKAMKWMGTLFIGCGCGLLIWLYAGNAKADNEQQEVIEAFKSIQVTEPLNETAESTSDGQAGSRDVSEVEGILSIPQIDLKAPVAKGADAQTLNRSLGAIEQMDPIGEVGGSYAIAGHQARVFGQFFNRLHEVEIGQELSFETLEKNLTFEVFNIKIVRPHEVDVLKARDGIAMLSLVTCYPAYSNDYRLVVQAKKIEE